MSEDDWDPELPLMPLLGSPGGGGGVDEISALLLETLCVITKLEFMLPETSEEEFAVVRGRLVALKDRVRWLPDEPKARRRLGFKVTKKGRK